MINVGDINNPTIIRGRMEWYPRISPFGPHSVIWFLALNSYNLDSALVVASAWNIGWSFLTYHLCSLEPRSQKEFPPCRKDSFQVFQHFNKCCGLDVKILQVASPVRCLCTDVPGWSKVRQGLGIINSPFEYHDTQYLTSDIHEVIQV